VVGPRGESRAMAVKFVLEKTAPLQTTLRTLLWLGVLVGSALLAALLIVTVFGSQ
jgi:hypothetical protein